MASHPLAKQPARAQITDPEPPRGFGFAVQDAGFVNHRVMGAKTICNLAASSKTTSLFTLFTMKSGFEVTVTLASDLAHIGTFTAAFIAQFREPACAGIGSKKDAGIMVKIDQTVSHIAFHKLLVP